jgi:large subunit ribosomal protein L9
MKAGPTGSLFGSVTPTDIADELWSTSKIRVDRRKIGIDNLKRIGRYEVPIDLFQDVRVEVKLVVVPEGGELPSEDELEAMEAVERAEQEAAAPPVEEPVYEYVDDEPASPAEAEQQDEQQDAAEPEPEWRADADEALRQK